MLPFWRDSIGQIVDSDIDVEANVATVSVAAVDIYSVALVSAVTVSVSADALTERFRTHFGD